MATVVTSAKFDNILTNFSIILESQFRDFYNLIELNHLDLFELFSVTLANDFVESTNGLSQPRVKVIFHTIVRPLSFILYLPGRASEICDHLLPTNSCICNRVCSSCLVHSVVTIDSSRWLWYLLGQGCTFLGIAFPTFRGWRIIVRGSLRFGSIFSHAAITSGISGSCLTWKSRAVSRASKNWEKLIQSTKNEPYHQYCFVITITSSSRSSHFIFNLDCRHPTTKLKQVQLQIQMREAITNLSKQQNSSLQRLLLHHNLDPKTSSKTQKYYRQIRKIYHHFDQQTYNLEDLMKAAIVIAEKSQLVYNIKGEKVKGLALSLNEMIKQNHSLGKLINIIKVFITHSKVLEEELREDLTVVVQEVAFGNNFVEKFQRAMEYFDFQERGDEAGYRSLFKSFAWLFFLQTRQRLGIQSQFQSDYLLISVLYLTVRYAFDYLRPKNIPYLDKSRTNQKNLVTSILQKLFQIFLIDDIDSFKKITSMVDDYFQSLIGSDIIKCLNFQCYDFLSPRLINVNYRKIDMLYQKQRNPNSIDYRLFFNNRLETLTPRRFSQISQVKEAIDARKRNFKQKSFASHKILTFQPQQSTQKGEQSQKFQQIKLPMNVKVSPSNTKTPMIWAFQQSPCSPIQNFMHREVRLSKTHTQRYADEQEIIDCIRTILGEYCDNIDLLEDKIYLTYNYYLVLMDKYLKQNSEEDSNDLHSSGLVYALEIMICSISVPVIEPEKVRVLLSSIREYIVTNGYYLWLINNFFQKVRDRLPSQIRELVIIMDELILNQLIWQQDHISDSFLEIYHTNLCRNSGKDNACMANLLEKVIEHIEDHVARLMSEFDTLQNSSQIQQLIDKTIKYIVLQTPEIIKTHNLLQIILCSFYLIFRANGANVKFNEIVTAFQQINSLKPAQYKRIINEIEIEVEEGLVYCNIIEFYNKYFLSFIKEHRREIECWNYNPIKTIVHRSRSEKEELPRFSFQAMKENHQKRHTMTEEQHQHNKKSNRLHSQSSPPVQTELPMKEKPDRQSFQVRNQTTMRSRPIAALLSCLNTEKIKSPVNIR